MRYTWPWQPIEPYASRRNGEKLIPLLALSSLLVFVSLGRGILEADDQPAGTLWWSRSLGTTDLALPNLNISGGRKGRRCGG
jgi:hypothetical protein